MLKFRNLCLVYNYCNVHTSTHLTAKPAKAMRKIMGLSSKKKRLYTESDILPSAEMFSKGSYEGKYSGNSKRTSVLNKLFMRYITDLMATGEYSSEFVGHGIEISKVQITPDYKGLNVYWIAKKANDEDEVEKILKKNAGYLRHELTTLRVIGIVPTINFVRDKKYSQIIEVDTRLAKADFGEDYVPMELITKLKAELELQSPFLQESKNKTEDDQNCPQPSETTDCQPFMPQDVFGLNHAEIFNRIQITIKKSQPIHRCAEDDDAKYEDLAYGKPIELTLSSSKEQRESFKKFLEKRELHRMKLKRREKNYIPDVEYIKEELQEQQSNYFKNMDIYEDEHDYIIEDEDGK